jgi:hypothetical protein
MKTAFLPLILLILYIPSICQQQVLDVSDPSSTGGNYGSIRFYDPSTLGIHSEEKTNYSDILGTPFWDDHWNAAHLFMKNGGIVKIDQVKINLYSNEIHYIHNGVELVAEKGSVQKVLLYKQQDTSKILALFEYYPDFSNKTSTDPAYFRVLNTGKVRLLILQKSLVNTAPYDPIEGKAQKSFFSKTYYAISNDGNISPLKSLDHANLFSVLYPDAVSEAWLQKNNNKLKKETEVISFLQFYNTQHK